MRLGIDFGTTRTVVAACDRGNTPVLGFEAPDGSVHNYIPTLAATDGTAWRYGWDAVDVLGTDGWHGVRSFKRALSGPSAGLHAQVAAGPFSASVFELLTGFLSHLREALAHSTHPGDAAAEAPIEAMIAVPAGASSAQRFATLEGFRSAGFVVRGLLNEPSAAGIEYAHRYRKSLTSNRQDVLVYDLGGGTFDASRVCMGDGTHVVTGHAGLGDVGGADVDDLLLALATAASGWSGPHDAALLERVRDAKEQITPNTRQVLVELDDDTAVPVKVADLYAACGPMLQRTLDALEPLADDEGLAGVYVVGGGSELPIVARTLKERFGRKVKRSAYASASIAVGLALALDGQGPVLEEQLSRAFGVFREARSGTDVMFDPILRPEQPIDGSEHVRRYRAVHNIGHLRFVECDAITDGAPDGDVTPFADLLVPYDSALEGTDLSATAVRSLSQGPVVEERYRISPEGMVALEVRNLDTGRVLAQWPHV